MNEVLVERLERAVWEITRLAQELEDLGYGRFAGMMDDIVADIEIDLQAGVVGTAEGT